MEKKLAKALFMVSLLIISANMLLYFNSIASYSVKVAYNYPSVRSISSQAEQIAETIAQDEEQVEKTISDDPSETIVFFPLELNTATQDELMLIPKIGEVTATRIIQYRERLGGYSALSQLKEIKGIGEKTYEEISQYLYLIDVN